MGCGLVSATLKEKSLEAYSIFVMFVLLTDTQV